MAKPSKHVKKAFAISSMVSFVALGTVVILAANTASIMGQVPDIGRLSGTFVYASSRTYAEIDYTIPTTWMYVNRPDKTAKGTLWAFALADEFRAVQWAYQLDHAGRTTRFTLSQLRKYTLNKGDNRWSMHRLDKDDVAKGWMFVPSDIPRSTEIPTTRIEISFSSEKKYYDQMEFCGFVPDSERRFKYATKQDPLSIAVQKLLEKKPISAFDPK